MTKLSYWERRQLRVKARQIDNTAQLERTMQTELVKTYHDIAKEASMWVDKYTKSQGVSSEQAMKSLQGIKTKHWRVTLKQFEAKAKQGGYEAELNEEYYRSRISRLGALEEQMRQLTRGLARKHTSNMRMALGKQYDDTYMRSTFNIQAQKGTFTSDFAHFNETQLRIIASEPWGKDGKDFSKRIWKNYQQELPSYLTDSLFRATIMGWGPDKVARMMHTQFQDVQRNKVHNLVTSEMGHMAEEATAKSYEESGIDEYEYMATLESHTCVDCAHLDGEHFRMSERKVGINYPLIHPRCRCTTVPYIADLPDVGERWMRDPETGKGKLIKNVKFDEWNKMVNDGEPTIAKTSGISSVISRKALPKNESLAAVLDSTNMREAVGAENYSKFIEHLNQVQDPEVRELFKEYGSKIEFEPMTSGGGVATRGNKVTLSQSSFTGDEMHVPLGAVYHELAHAMDNLAVQKLKGDSYYGSGVMKTTKMRLGKGWNVMESEVKLHQISSDPKYGLGKSIQRDLWEHTAGANVPMSDELGKKPRKAAEKKEWIEKSESVYEGKRKLEDWVNSTAKTVKNNPTDWSEVSDMIQGTGLYALGTNGPFGSGHGQSYFSKSRSLGTFENQASEFFAQLTEAKAANPGALKNINNIFPNSFKKYEQIIEDMTGRKRLMSDSETNTQQSGAISGALNDKNDPGQIKRNMFANSYYQELRNADSKTLISSMSSSSKVSSDAINRALNHILNSKYELFDPETYGTTMRTFDPSYDMAQSLRRLRVGTPLKHDIIMLKHESHEARLMDNKGMSYREAHELTNQIYNYQKALNEWKEDH